MSEEKPVPRLVQVALDGGKLVARVDLAALPQAKMADLLDAREWLVEFDRVSEGVADVAAIEHEIARRPFDLEGDEGAEDAADEVVREMLMEAMVDFAPRHLWRFLRAQDELMALVKAVAERADVPPLVRQRAGAALDALGGL